MKKMHTGVLSRSHASTGIKKVAALVSGGVDSAVSLKLLKDQGHDVTAFYLKIWLDDELAYLGDCPWETDLAYVRKVCEPLAVPIEVVSLQKEYRDEVVSYVISEIKVGRTPNPDILCNQRIKFGLFLDKIDSSFEKVASGHYAQIRSKSDRVELFCSPDLVKDQTYFLSHLSQNQLKRVMFPVGHLTKSEVRDLAHKFDLPNKDRKDSQGICFLGKLKFRDFVKHHLGEKTGPMIEAETKETIGEHQGDGFYTIGQRQGLGLSGGPWYVVAKDIKKNVVYISRNYYSADKRRDTFMVKQHSWIAQKRPEKCDLQIKMRHGAHFYNCVVVFENNMAQVQLNGRDQGIASGQFAVFYDGDVCLGGGMIAQLKS